MSMTPRAYSINALSTELHVDRRTIGRAISEHQVPVADRKGGHARYRIADVLAALDQRASRSDGRRASRAELSDIIALCRVPNEALLPWMPEAAEHLRSEGMLLTIPEYAEREGLEEDGEGDDILDWIAYGLPILPPAEGERFGRVSVPHAFVWRLGISGLIESLGGDGLGAVGAEMAKLRRRYGIA